MKHSHQSLNKRKIQTKTIINQFWKNTSLPICFFVKFRKPFIDFSSGRGWSHWLDSAFHFSHMSPFLSGCHLSGWWGKFTGEEYLLRRREAVEIVDNVNTDLHLAPRCRDAERSERARTQGGRWNVGSEGEFITLILSSWKKLIGFLKWLILGYTAAFVHGQNKHKLKVPRCGWCLIVYQKSPFAF